MRQENGHLSKVNFLKPSLNFRFQNQMSPKFSVRYTSSRGWGLFLGEDIKKGDFVVEYLGELISTNEYGWDFINKNVYLKKFRSSGCGTVRRAVAFLNLFESIHKQFLYSALFTVYY